MLTNQKHHKMEKSLIQFIASYFYEKGCEDVMLNLIEDTKNKGLENPIESCLKDYKTHMDEQRKESPHYHKNRLD